MVPPPDYTCGGRSDGAPHEDHPPFHALHGRELSQSHAGIDPYHLISKEY